MKKLFYKYPKTIGEELEAQIKYSKSIGYFKNNSDISLKMRELEKEIFGAERKYKCKEEEKSVNDEHTHLETERPATITALKKIKLNKKISNYLLLFSSFKVLNIIKEDKNIFELFDYYRIFPKKAEDISRIEMIKSENRQHYLSMCCQCKNTEQKRCENYDKCPFIKIKTKLIDIVENDEKIKLLYKLGFSSNWLDIIKVLNFNSYNISLQTFKNILEYLEMYDELEFVNFLEENYNKNFIKIIKDSKDDWRDEIQEQKTKIKKLKDTKDIKELQELIEEERKLKIINGYLKKSSNTEFEKIRPYYFNRIEDECYIKSKISKKAIH